MSFVEKRTNSRIIYPGAFGPTLHIEEFEFKIVDLGPCSVRFLVDDEEFYEGLHIKARIEFHDGTKEYREGTILRAEEVGEAVLLFSPQLDESRIKEERLFVSAASE